MTKQRSWRKIKSKPWKGWAVVYRDGGLGIPWVYREVAKDQLEENGGNGIRIARVLVTELRTKRKGKR